MITTPASLSRVDKKSAAQVLEQIASFLELKGENPFRIRAFRTASKTVAGLPGELAPALADGTLASTKGIGPATLQILLELVTNGRASLLEDLRDQVPPGLVDMLQIPGLGVAKIRQIHDTLRIDSVAELEEAAVDGSLAKLAALRAEDCGEHPQGDPVPAAGECLAPSHHAGEEAEVLRAALGQLKGVRQAIVAGDVRRRTEVVRDVVIVLTGDAPPAELFAQLSELPGVSEFAGQDERRVTLRFAGGTAAQVIVTTPVNLGAVLVQATGSDGHLRLLAAHAATVGYALSGAALWRGSEFVPTPDEATLYGALGLQLVPPELREGRDEIALAARGALPRLLERSDLARIPALPHQLQRRHQHRGTTGTRVPGAGLPLCRDHRSQPVSRVCGGLERR